MEGVFGCDSFLVGEVVDSMLLFVFDEICFKDEKQFLSYLRVAIVGRCGFFEPEDRLETADQWPSELLAADQSDQQLDQVAIEELKGRDVVDSQAQGVQALPYFCWPV